MHIYEICIFYTKRTEKSIIYEHYRIIKYIKLGGVVV